MTDVNKDYFLSRGINYFVENEIFNDYVINHLILTGFLINKRVLDVELFVSQEDKKEIKYILYFSWLWLKLINREKITSELQKVLKKEFPDYTVMVEYK